jgi:formylglycine-generating enzyme required for sulfatase activity
MEFVWLPAGDFDMGSNSGEENEKPVHRVHIDGFWMGKYEVTQGQWATVAGDNPSYFKSGSNYPVEQVSWIDVQRFIQRLNSLTGQTFRLPTEAEWEYACRAGSAAERYGNVNEIAWYLGNADNQTHPVGAKRPNSWGVYDVLGNVWEWCRDWYGSYGSGSIINPAGASSGSKRVFRGGSWHFPVQYIRAAYRDRYDPDFKNYRLGFRLARN